MRKSSAHKSRTLLWILSVVIAGSMICGLLSAIIPPGAPPPTPMPAVVWPTPAPTATPVAE
jgi:hypothetical protein